jgi:hypothetical protein
LSGGVAWLGFIFPQDMRTFKPLRVLLKVETVGLVADFGSSPGNALMVMVRAVINPLRMYCYSKILFGYFLGHTLMSCFPSLGSLNGPG